MDSDSSDPRQASNVNASRCGDSPLIPVPYPGIAKPTKSSVWSPNSEVSAHQRQLRSLSLTGGISSSGYPSRDDSNNVDSIHRWLKMSAKPNWNAYPDISKQLFDPNVITGSASGATEYDAVQAAAPIMASSNSSSHSGFRIRSEANIRSWIMAPEARECWSEEDRGFLKTFVKQPAINPELLSRSSVVQDLFQGHSNIRNANTSLTTPPYYGGCQNSEFRSLINSARGNNGLKPASLGPQIVEVWAYNLEEEFAKIRDVVEKYQYVAMDTEFPGVVARPTGSCADYHYKTIKYNVDLLKVIQLGVTFADENGRLPVGTSTWQFNFKFDLDRDMYAADSIEFLRNSGINFESHQNDGIDIQDFGEVIMSSGLVMNKMVKWISFHGSYDFGYVLKLLTCAPLPDTAKEFFELLCDFFPSLYDIKYLLVHCTSSKHESPLVGCSLQRVADHLEVSRVGPQHQAGSDSLVTCRTFFRLMATYFNNLLDDSKFSGVIYGLGEPESSRVPPPTQSLDTTADWFEDSSRFSDDGNGPVAAN